MGIRQIDGIRLDIVRNSQKFQCFHFRNHLLTLDPQPDILQIWAANAHPLQFWREINQTIQQQLVRSPFWGSEPEASPQRRPRRRVIGVPVGRHGPRRPPGGPESEPPEERVETMHTRGSRALKL